MNEARLARTLLASALALAVSACGGGGGGGGARPDPPPFGGTPTVPPPSPPPPPLSPSPPTTPQPAVDAHLTLTNAVEARDLGYTGAGYRIGVVDTGVNRRHPALAGRVVEPLLLYVDPRVNNVGVDDVVGHGTTVAQLAAGSAVGRWPGGVAPGAQIVSARIIYDDSPEDDGSGEGNEVDGALGLQQVHDDLVDAGVRIMNNSWGGLYWNSPGATAAIASEYRGFIFDNDGLVVFATGNEGRANPTDMAALPSQPGSGGTLPAADLERGWLAVAALDTAVPTQLADYSNACGLAMRYCLVAPGTAIFTGHDDVAGAPTYYFGSGTSYAAPLVSGAAAVVWQAFPYFSNDLVRQTLLGSAKDLGAPGVDPVFGYGLLDVGKAVRGPARFDWGDVDVGFDGFTSVWSNDIAGDGGLIKRGTGTLALAGEANSFTGLTQVLGGTLQTASLGGSARIGSGATLVGDGRVGGHIDNAGTLELGEGGLDVGRNYRQDAAGRLALNVGDALRVGGTATLNGELHVLGRRSYVSNGNTYTLVESAAGLSGVFSTVSARTGVFLQGAITYDSRNAYLNVTSMTVSSVAAQLPGITTASMASASRVDKAFAQIDQDRALGQGAIGSGFIDGAAALQQSADNASARASLESLSGQAHANALAGTFDVVDLGRRALSQQFGRGASAARQGTWYTTLGSVGQGSFAGMQGFALDGWMAGHEVALTGGASVAGVAFGEARINDVSGAGARGRDRQVQAQAYWGTRGEVGYMLGQVGTGQVSRDLERGLQLGQWRSGVASDYDARFVTANLEAGYRLQAAALALVPYVGADHVRIDSDGFSEQGGDGFGLRSEASVASRTQLLGGLRASYRWRGLSLQAYSEWQQTLDSAGLTRQASFVGVDAWSPLAAMQPGRSGGLLGVSLQAPLGQGGMLGFGYDQRFGGRGDDHAFGLRYAQGF